MRSFDEWFDENCDGSDLAKDACRKLWDEFSDQINIICRKSYEKQQSKIDELQKRVDSTLKVVQSMRNEVKHGHMSDDESQTLSGYANDLEQALKGGSND